MEILSPAATQVGACAEGHVRQPDHELAKLHAQVAHLQAEREALRWAAGHDELTGLPNRRLFYSLAPPLLGTDGRSAAMIVIDLDGFKPINDRHGHAVGDHVLRIVAYRLASWAGDNLVARLGGDEFAALLCGSGPAAYGKWWYPSIVTLAAVIAEPIAVAGHTVAVTASIGIAPSHCSTRVGDLLHQADMAMYQAKRHTKLTGACDTAWVCDRAGDHETIPLRGQLDLQHPKAIDSGHSEDHSEPQPIESTPVRVDDAAPATRPNVIELTIVAVRHQPDGQTPPACGPHERDPATVTLADAYRAGDPVWVYRNGAWRPGVVESASTRAVLARYRCAEGPGTGVDTIISAEYLAPRANADPQFDREPVGARLPRAA